jgi:hypothetical protein
MHPVGKIIFCWKDNVSLENDIVNRYRYKPFISGYARYIAAKRRSVNIVSYIVAVIVLEYS